MIMAMTLTEFLLARISEDETAADACASPGVPWQVNVVSTPKRTRYLVDQPADARDPVTAAAVAFAQESSGSPGRAFQRVAEVTAGFVAAEHIARHGPSRVLAECEAKRRIVELHQLMDYDQPYRGTPCCERCTAGGEYPADDGDTDEQNWPCPTLRALALPYADHPDYREEWKP